MKKKFLLTYTWIDSEGLEHYCYRWYRNKKDLIATVAKMESAIVNFQVDEVYKLKDYKKIEL